MKNIKYLILPLLAAGLVLTGCDDRMYKPEPPVRVESIALNAELAGGAEIYVGDELEVAGMVTVVPVTASDKLEEFTSSNPAVASVDESGKVTGLSPGTSEITITVDEKSDFFTLTVVPRPVIIVTDITLEEDEFELLLGEETVDLLSLIKLTPSQATYSDVTFASLDESVAVVTERGLVTTVGPGETKITITSNHAGEVRVEVSVTVVSERTHPDYTIVDGEVKSYSGTGGEIEIPYWATSIGDGVFKNKTTITKVDLNNVVSVGSEAFNNCSNTTELVGPKLTTIANANAFAGTNSLKTVNLPSMTRISGKVFNESSSIEELIIPKVTFIDHDNLQKLTSLRILDISSIVEIGRDVFRSATEITEVNLPASLGTIHGGMFSGAVKLMEYNLDPNNVAYKLEDGVIYSRDGTRIVSYPSGRTGSFRVPDGVTVTGRSAFSWSELTSLDLNEIVETGEYALYHMLNMTSCTAEALRIVSNATFREVNALRYLSLPSAVEIKGSSFQYLTNITIDLSEAAGLTAISGIPDATGITIYVASEEIKAKLTGTNYTVIVGSPQ